MKAIELTLYTSGEKAQFVIGGNALIMSEDEGTDQEGTVIYGIGGHITDSGIKVTETPKQIADLINGNQKESGWIKHTGDTIPFSENKFVLIELESGVITFGDAISFNWKRNDKINNIEYYKIIERRTK